MVDSIFLLGPEQKLVEMTAQPYDSEDLLQRLLADYPHLLAGQQIDEVTPRRWLLITPEMPVPGEEAGSGRWSLDHFSWIRKESRPSSRSNGAPTAVSAGR